MRYLDKEFTAKLHVAELVPSLIISLFLAETLFKLGSFSVECLLFLCTWFLTTGLLRSIRTQIK